MACSSRGLDETCCYSHLFHEPGLKSTATWVPSVEEIGSHLSVAGGFGLSFILGQMERVTTKGDPRITNIHVYNVSRCYTRAHSLYPKQESEIGMHRSDPEPIKKKHTVSRRDLTT